MIELLFVELGAVVTEIQGTNRCTVELFCDLAKPPTYAAAQRVVVDFTQSLDGGAAAQDALYDRYLGGTRPQLGMGWPGGGYEGIVAIRNEAVESNPLLAAAANSLEGNRWKYQFVTVIDESGEVQRYHGFDATVVAKDDPTITLEVGKQRRQIIYDPRNPDMASGFYAGGLVEGNVLRGGVAQGDTGAVFMAYTASSSLIGNDDELPKLPPSAGL